MILLGIPPCSPSGYGELYSSSESQKLPASGETELKEREEEVLLTSGFLKGAIAEV